MECFHSSCLGSHKNGCSGPLDVEEDSGCLFLEQAGKMMKDCVSFLA